jgi:hypothetical protein
MAVIYISMFHHKDAITLPHYCLVPRVVSDLMLPLPPLCWVLWVLRGLLAVLRWVLLLLWWALAALLLWDVERRRRHHVIIHRCNAPVGLSDCAFR